MQPLLTQEKLACESSGVRPQEQDLSPSRLVLSRCNAAVKTVPHSLAIDCRNQRLWVIQQEISLCHLLLVPDDPIPPKAALLLECRFFFGSITSSQPECPASSISGQDRRVDPAGNRKYQSSIRILPRAASLPAGRLLVPRFRRHDVLCVTLAESPTGGGRVCLRPPGESRDPRVGARSADPHRGLYLAPRTREALATSADLTQRIAP